MKKLFVGGMAAAFLLAAATASFAGIAGSRHDITNAAATTKYAAFSTMQEYGSCSACHIPHGATGEKLFPKTVGSGGGFYGPLCQLCHGNASGVADPGYDLFVNNTVLATGAHGLTIANINNRGDHNALATTDLPYADGTGPRGAGFIECTSCHDVHNSGKPPAGFPQASNRPFLWLSIDTLCQECHTNKAHNTLANVGTANNMGLTGSTHPAGANFTGNVSGGQSPINTAASWGGELVTNDISGASMWAVGSSWDSGFQLTGQGTTGGVSCPSCHDVHFDDGVPGGSDAPPGDNGTAYLASVDDGLPGDSQNFCEHCHRGGPGGVATPSAGGNYNNPGATAYTHPVDDVAAADGTVTGDLTWMAAIGTQMGTVGTGASGMICTSCHGLHASDTTPKTTLNTPILLNHGMTAAMDICSKCHTTANLGFLHHPVGGSYVTAGNTVGGLTCGGGDTEGYTTCHGSSGGVAHNRTSPLGDPDLGPAPTFCATCHSTNPSTYITYSTAAYAANGEASHFVGDAGALTFNKGTTTRATAADPIRQPADYGSSWSSNQLSQFLDGTGTGTVMICSSCHSLANGNIRSGDSDYAGGNGAGTAMLLEVAGADVVIGDAHTTAGVAADFTAAKYLCTGCHWAPAGTHPLNDADPAAYPLPGTIYGQSYTASGLNCESCHSAHTAATTSGNYILDGQAGTYGTGTAMAWEPTINYSGFCAVCHADFQ